MNKMASVSKADIVLPVEGQLCAGAGAEEGSESGLGPQGNREL